MGEHPHPSNDGNSRSDVAFALGVFVGVTGLAALATYRMRTRDPVLIIEDRSAVETGR